MNVTCTATSTHTQKCKVQKPRKHDAFSLLWSQLVQVSDFQLHVIQLIPLQFQLDGHHEVAEHRGSETSGGQVHHNLHDTD